MKKTLVAASILFFLANSSLFALVTDVQVTDKVMTARITVSGIYSADLKITFENVIGLNVNSLTLDATQVSLSNLLNRLSEPSFINLAGQFPVMISINPSSGSNLSFTGVVTVELDTSNLTFGSTLRLYSAPSGGVFEDITKFSGTGSYRVNGTKGRFSDFLIVTDVRDSGVAIQSKFDTLQQSLDANASKIDSGMVQTLQSQLTAALSAYQGGSKPTAISNLNTMINTITADNGNTIPNIYRADDTSAINVAGELRSRAATLIFSLAL